MKLLDPRGLFALAALALGTVTDASAAPVVAPHVTVELVAEREAVAPGFPMYVGLRFIPEPGWHVYWKNPGESGLPPRVTWKASPELKVGDLEFPLPEPIPYGPLVNYGYAGEVLFVASVRPESSLSSGDEVALTAQVKWLVCKDECVPGKATLSLHLPVVDAARAQASSSPEAALFKQTLKSIPVGAADLPGVEIIASSEKKAAGGEFTLTVRGAGTDPRQAYFFPEGDYGFTASAPQKARKTADGLKITIPQKEYRAVVDVSGVVRVGGRGIAFGKPIPAMAAVPAPVGESESLLLMLAFAFLGGLILNLMPCILPVLSIKVLALAAHSGIQAREFRKHGWVFTGGIFASFWVLAGVLLILRATGASLGWGFQLQSPAFILTLAILFFVMSLNLLGVFEIGTRLMGAGGNLAARPGYAGSFFTGVLTTVAATPCSAPFMGTALGFALTQPGGIAFAVLTALAAGLAFPYLAFSYLPGLARALPKPGMWMKTFKEFLAFPLLVTTIWLLSVLSHQAGVDAVVAALVTLVLIYAMIWLWNHSPRGPVMQIARGLLIAACLSGALLFARDATRIAAPTTSAAHGPWKTWSPNELADALKQKKTVFVNVTADWCVSCKVNERFVFENENVKARLGAEHVTALIGDWTNGDEALTRYIASVGRNSVPVYMLYKNGSAVPEVLPQILTPSLMLKKLGP